MIWKCNIYVSFTTENDYVYVLNYYFVPHEEDRPTRKPLIGLYRKANYILRRKTRSPLQNQTQASGTSIPDTIEVKVLYMILRETQ